MTKTFKVGDRVMCNGHVGAIGRVCEGQLSGMVEVQDGARTTTNSPLWSC